MPEVVAISGELGSGKSSVAHELAEALGIPHFSSGDAQRSLAERRGLSTLELNQLAEDDFSIDDEIDGGLRQLADEYRSFVVDSRLAWHLIPRAFKVHLVVHPRVGLKRIRQRTTAAESYSTIEEALRSVAERSRSEVRRFSSYYGVRIDLLRNYDLVIDTTRISTSEVVGVIEPIVRAEPSAIALKARPWLLLDPQRVRPTEQAVMRIGRPEMATLLESVSTEGFDDSCPIEVVRRDRSYYVLDGHRRLSAALSVGLSLVPAILLAEHEESLAGGVDVEEYLRGEVRDSWIYDWEAIHAFEFLPDV
jgi:predicted cytidylate kinase